MRNQLRYLSLIGMTASICYILLIPSEAPNPWLILTYISLIGNHLLVPITKLHHSSNTNLIFLSFTLSTLSTISCIVGSIFYLYLSPINLSQKNLLFLILYLQVNCLHSCLSSFELLSKPSTTPLTLISTNYL